MTRIHSLEMAAESQHRDIETAADSVVAIKDLNNSGSLFESLPTCGARIDIASRPGDENDKTLRPLKCKTLTNDQGMRTDLMPDHWYFSRKYNTIVVYDIFHTSTILLL